jgi:hypothetical protein
MRMNNPKAAAVKPWRHVISAAILATVGAPVAWLATFWALSQAAAVASAGYTAEGWVLAMRPVLIPVGMVIAWFAVRRSSPGGWPRAVQILGSGAAVSVIVLFSDGIESGGF